MGLDTTHNCFHGSYSSFDRWREDLHNMVCPERYMPLDRAWGDGYYDDQTIPINVLMDHSDCEGSIPSAMCGPLADTLEDLLRSHGAPSVWFTAITLRFIEGLRLAASLGEDVEFH